MRRMLVLAIVVLAGALGVMTAATSTLNRAVDRASDLGSEAVLAAQEGRPDRAEEMVTALAEHWRACTPALEVIADHDALHEVQTGIAEARICLECDDHDDFLRCMAVVDGALAHLRDEEALSLANLY